MNNNLNSLQRCLHEFVNFFFQFCFRTVDHVQVWFGKRMFCHENSTTVFEWLNGCFIGSDFPGSFYDFLSGGIDSPVAGYMIAKRGVKIDAVYFHAPPYTSERAKQKVVDLAKQVAKYSGPIRLHVINFTDIQLYIYDQCPQDELTIIMRRYMMRIAEHFAKESRCLGLITGESIGQVASQTLQSLAATNEVCTLPVYRYGNRRQIRYRIIFSQSLRNCLPVPLFLYTRVSSSNIRK